MTSAVCLQCRRRFRPDPRTAGFQKTCGRSACQAARQRAKGQRWWALHRDYAASRQGKIRAWARAYPDYWRVYRRAHAAYRDRDNERRRQSRRRSKIAAKQTAISEISRRKLAELAQLAEGFCAAKQTPIYRLSRGLLDYLFWREVSAKQTPMVLVRPPSG